jgi:electron transfer flavoprotein alpha subunit
LKMPRTLVLIEYDERGVRASSLSAITFARELGGEYALLIVGNGVTGLAEAVQTYGATHVYVIEHDRLVHALADRWASAIAEFANSQMYSVIAAASSTQSKDILPRVAALLDRPMLSDVISMRRSGDDLEFCRPVYAGSLIATMRLDSPDAVFTVRAAGFEQPARVTDFCSPVIRVPIATEAIPEGTEFVSNALSQSSRPDLTEARVVISGGRPLRDADTFERLIGTLADVLQGAAGSTRAAVDAGIVPNDLQIGQTGKVISPELYIAAGVSGAIQHIAGIRDARIIVAINSDPEAPIFKSAAYGLVGDLYQIVPELTEAIRKL